MDYNTKCKIEDLRAILALRGPDIETEVSDALRSLMHYRWRIRRPTVTKTHNRRQLVLLRLMERAGRLNRGQAAILRRIRAAIAGEASPAFPLYA